MFREKIEKLKAVSRGGGAQAGPPLRCGLDLGEDIGASSCAKRVPPRTFAAQTRAAQAEREAPWFFTRIVRDNVRLLASPHEFSGDWRRGIHRIACRRAIVADGPCGLGAG